MNVTQEETKPELEQKLKDQLQDATPKPTQSKDTTTITINGDIVVNGDNIGAIISATTIIIQPTITINLTTPKITHFLAKLIRQIKRKTATQRQITRNPKNRPNPPQPQPSRHIQPNHAKSPITPNIPLLHNLNPDHIETQSNSSQEAVNPDKIAA